MLETEPEGVDATGRHKFDQLGILVTHLGGDRLIACGQFLFNA